MGPPGPHDAPLPCPTKDGVPSGHQRGPRRAPSALAQAAHDDDAGVVGKAWPDVVAPLVARQLVALRAQLVGLLEAGLGVVTTGDAPPPRGTIGTDDGRRLSPRAASGDDVGSAQKDQATPGPRAGAVP